MTNRHGALSELIKQTSNGNWRSKLLWGQREDASDLTPADVARIINDKF